MKPVINCEIEKRPSLWYLVKEQMQKDIVSIRERTREAVNAFFAAPFHEKMNKIGVLTIAAVVWGSGFYCINKINEVAKRNLSPDIYYPLYYTAMFSIYVLVNETNKKEKNQKVV